MVRGRAGAWVEAGRSAIRGSRLGLLVGLGQGALLFCGGCAVPSPAFPPDAQQVSAVGGTGAFRESFRAAVTAAVARRGTIRHAGLGLPAVSPDGRWIAALEAAGGPLAVSQDGPLTGRGLEGVSLWVRPVEPVETQGTQEAFGNAVPVALEGASHPSWSPGGKLWFVGTHSSGADLLVWDPESGAIRRRSSGLRHVVSLAVSADESTVAVSAHAGNPESSRLFFVDAETGQATPGPALTPGATAQTLPTWAAPGLLLFVELREAADAAPAASALRLVDLATGEVVDLGLLPAMGSVFDAVALLAGVPSPLSPDGESWLFFDASAEPAGLWRLLLANGRREPVAEGGTAAVWWKPDLLIAAVQPGFAGGIGSSTGLAKEPGLRLISLADGSRGSVTLLPGDWAPLWRGSGGPDQVAAIVLAATPGDRMDRLQLVRLDIAPPPAP